MASSALEPTTGGGIYTVTFNQDFTSVGIGSKRGFLIYNLNSDDEMEVICRSRDEVDICIVERLFSSSLVGTVSISSPRKLKVLHFKKDSEICNYSYPNTILSVKLNRSRVVVCLEEWLYIHNIRDMKVVHTIKDTPPNPTGLCALSSSENCYLAYPGSNTVGQILIFDASLLQSKSMINAHDSPLAALCFNDAATKIATASEKGTVIRVFNVADGCKLYEFRRGMKRCANIYSMNFSTNSMYLVTSSNTETVHVFKLGNKSEIDKPVQDDQSFAGWVSNVVSSSASYLPTPVTEMWNQGRAFITCTLPFSGMRNQVAIVCIKKALRLAVASADGFLYLYAFNEVDGGEATLMKQHQLFGSPDSISDSVPIPLSTGYPGSARQSETKAERMSEIANACELPPMDALALDDESEYPPM